MLSSNEDIDWVGILDENTELNLRVLGEYVKMKQGELSPKTTSLFMGHELTDEESTIIHHFSSSELRYPDTQAGIFLSRKLVLDLQEKYTGDPSLDFHIDPAYELTDFIKAQLGIELTNVKELCLREPKKAGDKCITYPRHPYSCIKRGDGGEQLKMLESVYTIVSTCQQYHNTRVEIVKKTWADLIPNLHFIRLTDKV
ncbi:beta-1,3-glucosyltransferase isoform X2 [Eurytemora carolleeae]|uniref:beta-1,3-glucosyltransferase isoform X2 n=1 Tax=Eurytemora carolleeae TaxID=1294199 RepID=UPI000C76E7FB|nr:beta-1,3-glucosyltransferase isoform X2 [Eurytemora carolleeae]|eukprot:XP_023342428.1 beta-1,3-glucosyltransferase-like isoform X2 [Eurytemora affinis]